MNNLAARFFFAFIGVMLVVSFIINRWINKELVETLKPSIVASGKKALPPEQIVVQQQYDMNSDYPPSGPAQLKEVMPLVNKTKRILDEKIIYEMPTSNKILLQ